MKKVLPVIGAAVLCGFTFIRLHAENLAGRTYNHTIGTDFAFTNTYEDYAGLTYNPLSQTFYMTDNKLDKIIEINSAGTLLRTIDILGIRKPGETTADAEGITWMYGQQYALVMEGGEEMAVAIITSTTTSLTRSQVRIFDLSGDPKGVSYKVSEDALYWVSQSGPKRVVKARLNKTTGNLDQLANVNADNLPVSDLADVTFFPRLSQNTFLISQSSFTVMEVNLNVLPPVVVSTFSLAAWPIPSAGAMAFAADSQMYVVGKHVGGAPEDDFNVFTPTAPLANRAPFARIKRF